MASIDLNSYYEFLEHIDIVRNSIRIRYKNKATTLTEPLFRGQEDYLWPLDTTLERRTTEPYTYLRYNGLLNAVGCQVESFTGKDWNLTYQDDFSSDHIPLPPNHQFMIYARHHGFPAPILDWTRSEYVALFFAFKNATASERVSVYIYIDTLTGGKVANIGTPQILRTNQNTRTHPRHFAQQAQYTIAATRSQNTNQWEYCSHKLAFDSVRAISEDQDVLIKLTLPSNLRKSVLEKLHRMNINAFTLFGNEDALMEEMAFKEIDLRRYKNDKPVV